MIPDFAHIRLAAPENNAGLNKYIRHTGSALFAVPPGLGAARDWCGKALFS